MAVVVGSGDEYLDRPAGDLIAAFEDNAVRARVRRPRDPARLSWIPGHERALAAELVGWP